MVARKDCITTDGYRRIWAPDHPVAMADGNALEHRVVAWDAGLLTDRADHVHHINGDKLDNRPENLEVLSNSEHVVKHARERGHTGEVEARERYYRSPKPERTCALDGCEEPVPLDRRRHARYCCDAHGSTHRVRQLRQRRAG